MGSFFFFLSLNWFEKKVFIDRPVLSFRYKHIQSCSGFVVASVNLK